MAKKQTIGISVKNDHSEEAIQEMHDAVMRAFEICGGKAAGYAVLAAPVLTGRLKNSITYITKDKQGPANQFGRGEEAEPKDYKAHKTPEDQSVYIGTNVEYAAYQELGWRGHAPANGGKGYIKPAIEDHISEYKDIIQTELEGR